MILLVFAFSFVIMPVNYLVQNLHAGEETYNMSNALKQYGVHGNVATTSDRLAEMENLKYYMNITSYRVSKQNLSVLEFRNELKNYDTDYYFVWGNSNQSYYMSGYKEITDGKIKNLKVYSLNP